MMRHLYSYQEYIELCHDVRNSLMVMGYSGRKLFAIWETLKIDNCVDKTNKKMLEDELKRIDECIKRCDLSMELALEVWKNSIIEYNENKVKNASK